MADLTTIVARLISEDPDHVGEHFAAVACVEGNCGSWLLGLSTANDDRRSKWCFPGGGIEHYDASPAQAAARECLEETGIVVRPRGGVIELPAKPGVAFVHCLPVGGHLRGSSEFSQLGFFTLREMADLDLYDNVLQLIRRIGY